MFNMSGGTVSVFTFLLKRQWKKNMKTPCKDNKFFTSGPFSVIVQSVDNICNCTIGFGIRHGSGPSCMYI